MRYIPAAVLTSHYNSATTCVFSRITEHHAETFSHGLPVPQTLYFNLRMPHENRTSWQENRAAVFLLIH